MTERVPRPAAPRRGGPAGGVIPALARLCILGSVPVSLVWYPLMRVEGVGTVTLGDGLFVLLWALVAAAVVRRGSIPAADKLPGGIVLLAFYLALCAGLGAAIGGGVNTPGRELVQFLKRFGFAAVLPLAMNMFASRSLRRASTVLVFLGTVAMTVFVLYPELRSLLPINETREDAGALAGLSVRPTGMITNPNDLAYFSVIALALLLALLRSNPGGGLRSAAVAGVAAAAALTSTVLSGSRSGVVGLVVGAGYFLLRARRSVLSKVLLLLAVLVAGLAGWRYSEEFRDRMRHAVEQGAREVNFSARLEAQRVSLTASLEHPAGVGYGNFAGAATGVGQGAAFDQLQGADSMYLDTLLGAGFAGLAFLVALLAVCWRHLRALGRASPAAADFLNSGFVAALTFGFATVSPMSVFISPIFFYLVGAAALLRPEGGAGPRAT